MTKWLACLGFVACLGGCDSSKAELESTKAQLATVSQERDDLKKQVTSLQKDLESSKSALAEAKVPPPVAPASKADAKDSKAKK